MDYNDVVKFHGHDCPGLAIGYRMARSAMKALEAIRSEDEEVVAIVENDACGVDALQCLTGCTFGKGNLVYRDHGKQVYTLFSRKTGQGVRVVYHGDGVPGELRDDRQARVAHILSAPEAGLLTVSSVTESAPEPARIRSSVLCVFCGERVMETRVQDLRGRPACIPCREASGGNRS